MTEMKPANHWMVRPTTIRWAAIIGVIILGLTIGAQLFIDVKGRFEVDNLFAFAAIFGFLCCVAMVLVAKFLGRFLKRKEDYYDD
ncbi:MAG: hypothetical protein P8P30_09160 [Rickettsiales bacterium]|nr:hypothetical protein [Rickettsiales bacterium]